MGLFKVHATNHDLERDGARFELTDSPNPDGTIPTLIIARTFRESQKWQAIYTRVTKPYKHQLDRGEEIPEELNSSLMVTIFTENNMRGWENVRLPEGVFGIGKGEGQPIGIDGNGAIAKPVDEQLRYNRECYDITFTVENAKLLFNGLSDVFKQAADFGASSDSYKVGDLEAMAKN